MSDLLEAKIIQLVEQRCASIMPGGQFAGTVLGLWMLKWCAINGVSSERVSSIELL